MVHQAESLYLARLNTSGRSPGIPEGAVKDKLTYCYSFLRHGIHTEESKLNELGVKEKYQTEITNRFAALENLNGDKNITRAWENIKENIKTSAKESLGLQE